MTNSSRRVGPAPAANGGPRRRLDTWLAPLAPALLAAFHLGGLLFFLNPRLPPGFGSLAVAALVYFALLALPSTALHLALARATRRPVRRLLPWSLTLVVLGAALGDGVHASYFSFYLPAGINLQLIKTALWLSAGALLLFYTALLHTIHGRRYGPRSQLFLLLVALGTVYAMFDRRGSYRPPPVAAARPAPAASTERAPRLALVALPGATLDAILPLAEQGKLPFIQSLLESGVRARLATLAPNRPLALWATLATGKLPHRHGLESERLVDVPWLPGAPLRLLPRAVGFERWGLPGGQPRAARAGDRTAVPLWTTLSALGRASAAFGFPAVLDGGDVAPASAALALLPAERELVALGQPGLARALAGDRVRLAAARARLASGELAALFVRLDGLEQASRACFGGFAAAEFEGARAGRVRRAADALAAYYGGLDGELAALWAELPEPRLLVVVSPYGVAAPSGLGRILLDLAGRPRLEGRIEGAPDGVWLARGEGVRLGVQVPGAALADVVPTLLYALGLPIARDLDGKVLAAGFEPALLQRRSLTFVPTYEGVVPPAALSAP